MHYVVPCGIEHKQKLLAKECEDLLYCVNCSTNEAVKLNDQCTSYAGEKHKVQVGKFIMPSNILVLSEYWWAQSPIGFQTSGILELEIPFQRSLQLPFFFLYFG